MQEDKVTAIVEKIVFKSEDTGFHVLNVTRKDTQKNCIVTVNHLKVIEGCSYEFTGKWVSNPRYGNQFQSDKITEIAPETREAMVKYLSSSFFKGIGPVIAKKIVQHFGESTLEVLKTDIDRLVEVPGAPKVITDKT
jgi:exodeoxyribonuclease V alpha subunit